MDGNGVLDFAGDAHCLAKAALLPPSSFGKRGDFDIDKNGMLDFVGDVLTEVKFALGRQGMQVAPRAF